MQAQGLVDVATMRYVRRNRRPRSEGAKDCSHYVTGG